MVFLTIPISFRVQVALKNAYASGWKSPRDCHWLLVDCTEAQKTPSLECRPSISVCVHNDSKKTGKRLRSVGFNFRTYAITRRAVPAVSCVFAHARAEKGVFSWVQLLYVSYHDTGSSRCVLCVCSKTTTWFIPSPPLLLPPHRPPPRPFIMYSPNDMPISALSLNLNSEAPKL